jgi:hypothetical protein
MPAPASALRRNGAATPAGHDGAMPRKTVPSAPPQVQPVELRLVVWVAPGGDWRARVSGPGMAEREFVSPFELARFVAAPPSTLASNGSGLR